MCVYDCWSGVNCVSTFYTCVRSEWASWLCEMTNGRRPFYSHKVRREYLICRHFLTLYEYQGVGIIATIIQFSFSERSTWAWLLVCMDSWTLLVISDIYLHVFTCGCSHLVCLWWLLSGCQLLYCLALVAHHRGLVQSVLQFGHCTASEEGGTMGDRCPFPWGMSAQSQPQPISAGTQSL